MKYFKCGQCQSPYKIDETKIEAAQAVVTCARCGAKNVLRFGPVLIAQGKDKIQQFSLKEGVNTLGRKSKKPEADLQVEDEYVSRKHATVTIENRNNKFFIGIEDNGSLNGTYNKNKIRLKSGLKYPFLQDEYFIIGLTKLSLKIN